MANYLNKATIIGNLGADPEIKTFDSGAEGAFLRVATSDRWKDKVTGELKERTEWHRVAIYNPAFVRYAKEYLRKGCKVYLEGIISHREWESPDGVKRSLAEIVLKNYGGELINLTPRTGNGTTYERPAERDGEEGAVPDFLEDEIPF